MSALRRIGPRDLGITRGALVILGLQVGLSLVWLLSPATARATLERYVVATPEAVFGRGYAWTLVTTHLLEVSFVTLLLNGVLMWALIPVLERFWGTPRFYRFAALTSIAGALGGTAAGLALGLDHPIHGLGAFMFATVVAFGVVYARQPVQFFGVLPLTGRQFMYGMIGFTALFVLLQGLWPQGAADAAAAGVAVVATSKRWSPGLAWRRWRIARARARLTVVHGGAAGKGAPRPPAGRPDDQRWLN